MDESIITSLEEIFQDKLLLTVQDICFGLGCEETVVYNWMKRADPDRRPPKLRVGQALRFPRRPFVRWLAKEQS
jgi:predicted DNA-binding transcriptional regulator AlpA